VYFLQNIIDGNNFPILFSILRVSNDSNVMLNKHTPRQQEPENRIGRPVLNFKASSVDQMREGRLNHNNDSKINLRDVKYTDEDYNREMAAQQKLREANQQSNNVKFKDFSVVNKIDISDLYDSKSSDDANSKNVNNRQ